MLATRLECQGKTKPRHARRNEQCSSGRQLLRLILWACLIVTILAVPTAAQYKGDDIPGFTGLQSGTQAPPGLYLGNVVWVYPTSTIKDNNGNSISLPGSLTSTAEIILVSLVTDYKLFGANIGGSVGFPFIKNRIQLDSLDVNTGFAYTDMFAGASLGWHLKRADITAGYNLYIPTGKFSQGGSDNTGLGMWGNEFTIGTKLDSSYLAAAFFACALTLAQRSFIALEIFALPFADSTCFFAREMSRPAVLPRTFAADCKPIKSCCNLAICFFTFFSSRLIAANMLMDPPQAIYMRRRVKPIPCPWDVLFSLSAG
jgi:hypothetical protein